MISFFLTLGFAVLLSQVALGVILGCLVVFLNSFVACICTNLPLRTAFAASHRFWISCFHFHLSLGFFIYSLISSANHWFFSSMLFSLHMFGVIFFRFFLLVDSCLIPLQLEKTFEIISIFLTLLRLALWPSLWTSCWTTYVPLKTLCILLLFYGCSVYINYTH